MTQVANRISSRTILRFGLATAPVALFKTTGDPEGEPKFATAGPHGRPLETGPVQNGRRVEHSESTPRRAPPVTEVPDAPIEERPIRADDAEPEEDPVRVGLLEQGHDEELDPERDVRRGLFIGEKADQFIDLTSTLEQIDEATILDEMEVIAFVRRERVPRFRITGSYYLGGDGAGANKMIRLLLESMRSTSRVAVVKWTKRRGQALGVITPLGAQAVAVLELAWASQVREAGPRMLGHLEADVTESEVETAVELAEAMADAADVIDEQEDERVSLLRELAARAEDGTLSQLDVPEPLDADPDAELADLLAESLAAARRS